MVVPGTAVRDAPSESWPSGEESDADARPSSRLAAALNARGAEVRRSRRRHMQESTPPGAMAYGVGAEEVSRSSKGEGNVPTPKRRSPAAGAKADRRRGGPVENAPAPKDRPAPPAETVAEPTVAQPTVVRQAAPSRETGPRQVAGEAASRRPGPSETSPREAPSPETGPRPVASRAPAPRAAGPRVGVVPPGRRPSRQRAVEPDPTVARRAPPAEATPTVVRRAAVPQSRSVQVRRRPVAEPVPAVAAADPVELGGPPSGAIRVRVTPQPPQPRPRVAGMSRPRRERAPRPSIVVLGGLVWVGLLVATFDYSPVLLGVVVAPVAVIAVLSAWRTVTHLADTTPADGATGRAGLGDEATGGTGLGDGVTAVAGEEPEPTRSGFGMPVPSALTGLVMLGVTPIVAGIGGTVAMIVWLVVATAALAWPYLDQPRGVLRRALLASVLPALGAGCLVLADKQASEIGMVLIAGYCLFDVANAAMGTGKTGGLVGAVSGFVTLLVLAVIVQALLAPPFTGATPWIVCVMIGVLAPVGVRVCSRLAPGRLPALRRLDSLVFMAPVWCVTVSVLLHR
jgi:hypothetical protein